MKIRKRSLLVLLLLALPLSSVHAQWFGPDNYDECILEGMKGVTSDLAAAEIRQACRRKFNQKSSLPERVKVPDEVLANLSGTGGMNGFGGFSGEIYNGNSDWVINKVTIRLVAADNGSIGPGGAKHIDFQETILVGPLKTERFTVRTSSLPASDINWYIVGAVGYEKNWQ